MTLNLLDAHIFDSEVGHFVSETHRIVAEVIQDYEPTLFLIYIPPEKRSFDDTQPFALLHCPVDKPQYVVRKMKPEEVSADLLAWLWSNDQARNARDLHGYLAAKEAAEKAMRLKQQKERSESDGNFVTSVLKGKNWYRHNGITYS